MLIPARPTAETSQTTSPTACGSCAPLLESHTITTVQARNRSVRRGTHGDILCRALRNGRCLHRRWNLLGQGAQQTLPESKLFLAGPAHPRLIQETLSDALQDRSPVLCTRSEFVHSTCENTTEIGLAIWPQICIRILLTLSVFLQIPPDVKTSDAISKPLALLIPHMPKSLEEILRGLPLTRQPHIRLAEAILP